jgi:hypothetical protein
MSQGINRLYSKEVLLKREDLSYREEKICITREASTQAIVQPVAHVLVPEPYNRGLDPLQYRLPY